MDHLNLEAFLNALTTGMESHLQQALRRRHIGFTVTAQPEGSGFRLRVPDYLERDTVFDLHLLDPLHGQPLCQGRVLTVEERSLLTLVAKETLSTEVRVEVEVHPYPQVDPAFGVTTPPVSNLYVHPRVETGENLASQARLGTPVQILDYTLDRTMARIRSADDGYVAWMSSSDIKPMDFADYQTWIQSRRAIVLQLDLPGVPLGAWLPLGAVPGPVDPHRVLLSLPTGAMASVNSQQSLIDPSPGLDLLSLVQTAEWFLPHGRQGRVTYLWGGTVGQDLDCSGYVQTVFRLHQVFLPRDADQQMMVTQSVAPTLADRDHLQPGDLVFFSENRQDATHVGIYTGQGHLIHSSPKGDYSGVKINLLQGGDDYDRYLQSIYFGGGRVVDFSPHGS